MLIQSEAKANHRHSRQNGSKIFCQLTNLLFVHILHFTRIFGLFQCFSRPLMCVPLRNSLVRQFDMSQSTVCSWFPPIWLTYRLAPVLSPLKPAIYQPRATLSDHGPDAHHAFVCSPPSCCPALRLTLCGSVSHPGLTPCSALYACSLPDILSLGLAVSRRHSLPAALSVRLGFRLSYSDPWVVFGVFLPFANKIY